MVETETIVSQKTEHFKDGPQPIAHKSQNKLPNTTTAAKSKAGLTETDFPSQAHETYAQDISSKRTSTINGSKKKMIVGAMNDAPAFPQVEGGRDFDEEVEDRIRLTRAYNEQVMAAVAGTTSGQKLT